MTGCTSLPPSGGMIVLKLYLGQALNSEAGYLLRAAESVMPC